MGIYTNENCELCWNFWKLGLAKLHTLVSCHSTLTYFSDTLCQLYTTKTVSFRRVFVFCFFPHATLSLLFYALFYSFFLFHCSVVLFHRSCSHQYTPLLSAKGKKNAVVPFRFHAHDIIFPQTVSMHSLPLVSAVFHLNRFSHSSIPLFFFSSKFRTFHSFCVSGWWSVKFSLLGSQNRFLFFFGVTLSFLCALHGVDLTELP